MALPTSYLVTTKNITPFFDAIISAQAPERVSQKFLENLDFKSSNDRLYMPLLRILGFIDENSVPTQRYFDFLDQTQSKRILSEAIKEAYADLFAINKKAYEMTTEEVKNKMRTLTQGQKSENIVGLMANTFRALSDYADWTEPKTIIKEKAIVQDETKDIKLEEKKQLFEEPQFHYNIQIHLPETRDSAVYDAIFKSLREHLL